MSKYFVSYVVTVHPVKSLDETRTYGNRVLKLHTPEMHESDIRAFEAAVEKTVLQNYPRHEVRVVVLNFQPLGGN